MESINIQNFELKEFSFNLNDSNNIEKIYIKFQSKNLFNIKYFNKFNFFKKYFLIIKNNNGEQKMFKLSLKDIDIVRKYVFQINYKLKNRNLN
jgi:hypothetical protein